MTRSRQIWILAVLLLCGATACIRENIDDCETPVTLDFLYFGDGIIDIFPERIRTVDMFVYRENGDLAATVSCSEEDLASDQGVDLRLMPGNYRIVCWGNAWENTHLEAEADEPYLGESSWFDGEDCQGIDPLYFGEKTLTVPRTLKPVRDTVIYTCSHISIQVTMEGFANADNFNAAPAADGHNAPSTAPLITLSHEDLSAWIDFGNTPSEETTDYKPVISDHSEKADSYITLYRVPKFTNETGSQLTIVRNDTGAELYCRSFADIINTLGIDVTSRDEVSIELIIRVWSMDGEVNIDIIGWNSETVFPIL